MFIGCFRMGWPSRNWARYSVTNRFRKAITSDLSTDFSTQKTSTGPTKTSWMWCQVSSKFAFPFGSMHRNVNRFAYFMFVSRLPDQYCKQLYLDVTNSNNGKITWNYIKPIIQGKILYGPVNAQTKNIVENVKPISLCVVWRFVFISFVEAILSAHFSLFSKRNDRQMQPFWRCSGCKPSSKVSIPA